ncbi:MAG TPA: PH domain-containing protein [Candidatus Dojkabacteria bacterium]|nr:PH domain-containing protein [Candidatus Dojkabacteria bacterium]
MPTKVPKKILAANKSFVQRIADSFDKSPVTSFVAFPQQTSFDGQDKDENIILIIRQHPAVYIPQFFLVLALIVVAIVFNVALSNLDLVVGTRIALTAGLGIFFFLIVLAVIFYTFIKWFYTVNIVTDERIVDLDFKNILAHEYSEAQIEKIEDVTHRVNGFLGLLFDFGTVTIQTAGTKPEFEFDNVPRPRDVQDTLLDLLEMKQKGQI